jgi:hypothetical protein
MAAAPFFSMPARAPPKSLLGFGGEQEAVMDLLTDDELRNELHFRQNLLRRFATGEVNLGGPHDGREEAKKVRLHQVTAAIESELDKRRQAVTTLAASSEYRTSESVEGVS